MTGEHRIYYPVISGNHPVTSRVLKEFIADFDFPSPNWHNLPAGFPNLSKDGLTKQEGHLLDGIKLAWAVDAGRQTFYKNTARRIFIVTAVVILILFGKTVITKPGIKVAHSVSAKTVSTAVGNIVEATMSAVFAKR